MVAALLTGFMLIAYTGQIIVAQGIPNFLDEGGTTRALVIVGDRNRDVEHRHGGPGQPRGPAAILYRLADEGIDRG